jgi:hypothetical protein
MRYSAVDALMFVSCLFTRILERGKISAITARYPYLTAIFAFSCYACFFWAWNEKYNERNVVFLLVHGCFYGSLAY